jgi:hypothetical protein
VLGGIFAGLALCALAFVALRLTNAPAPNPSPVAHAICADLTSQRYGALYTLLSPDLQGQGTEAQFAASQRELDRLVGVVHGCQASVGSVDGGVASVTLTLQRGTSASITAPLALTQSQGAWRISSYDQNF